MEEIISLIEPWAGSRSQAEAWYHSQTINALGGLTAEQIVNQGHFDELKEYLNHIEAGGFA